MTVDEARTSCDLLDFSADDVGAAGGREGCEGGLKANIGLGGTDFSFSFSSAAGAGAFDAPLPKKDGAGVAGFPLPKLNADLVDVLPVSVLLLSSTCMPSL